MNEYREMSTPDLTDLQQEEETDAIIEVPVRLVNTATVQAHLLPSRDASMRSVTVDTNVQQIVGANLRRRIMRVWATAATASTIVYIGTDKNQVESSTAAVLPAVVDTLADGMPLVLPMTHGLQVWAKAVGANPVTLSVVTEDWAD